MPAVNYDIEIDDNRAFNLEFVWYDKTGTPVDITSYGAKYAVKDMDGNLLAEGDHDDNDVTVGTDDGLFQLLIPSTKTAGWDIREFVWEFIVFAIPEEPYNNPISLLGGNGIYNSSVVDTTEV